MPRDPPFVWDFRTRVCVCKEGEKIYMEGREEGRGESFQSLMCSVLNHEMVGLGLHLSWGDSSSNPQWASRMPPSMLAEGRLCVAQP